MDEEKSDLEPMPSCAPNVCGMEGLIVIDVNDGLTLDEWETPVVNGDDVLLNPRGVPNMVETMALTDDTVGFTLAKTSESWVLDGVTIPEVCVGLELSAVKDTEEASVEVGPSMEQQSQKWDYSDQSMEKVEVILFAFWENAMIMGFDI